MVILKEETKVEARPTRAQRRQDLQDFYEISAGNPAITKKFSEPYSIDSQSPIDLLVHAHYEVSDLLLGFKWCEKGFVEELARGGLKPAVLGYGSGR